MQCRGRMSEEVVAARIDPWCDLQDCQAVFPRFTPPEVTLFHIELARCDQVERPENGLIPWKNASEDRLASVLAPGNSDTKIPRNQRKNKSQCAGRNPENPRKIEEPARKMPPIFLLRIRRYSQSGSADPDRRAAQGVWPAFRAPRLRTSLSSTGVERWCSALEVPCRPTSGPNDDLLSFSRTFVNLHCATHSSFLHVLLRRA